MNSINQYCPFGNNTLQKRASLSHQMRTTFDNLGGSEVRKRKENLLEICKQALFSVFLAWATYMQIGLEL